MLRAVRVRTFESKLLLLFVVLLSVLVYLIFGGMKQTAGLPGTGTTGFRGAHQSFMSAASVGLQEVELLKPYSPPPASSQTTPSSSASAVPDSNSGSAPSPANSQLEELEQVPKKTKIPPVKQH